MKNTCNSNRFSFVDTMIIIISILRLRILRSLLICA